jgi:hypothetical protein
VIECSTIVVENPFIKHGLGLQSFGEIAASVESHDGGILRINSYILDLVWYWVKLMPIMTNNH